jgi:pilus assembly protein CpaD
MTMSIPKPGSRRARTLLATVAIAASAVFSAGCTQLSGTEVNLARHDHHLRHPILISEEPEEFRLPVGMNGPALSLEIEAALRDYVRDYQADGTGAITIQVPAASANEIAAASTGRALHYALVRAGVPHGSIQVVPFHVGNHAEVAPVNISYLRVKAVVPRCGVWPETMPASYQNDQYHNLGCAAQQNLAAMVANPADLVRPQPSAPAHGARRANVIKVYVEIGNPGWTPAPHNALIDTELGN